MSRFVIWRYTTGWGFCYVLRAAVEQPVYGPASLVKCRAWCALHRCLHPPVEFREG